MTKLIKRIPSKICSRCDKLYFKKKTESLNGFNNRICCSRKCFRYELSNDQLLKLLFRKTITTSTGCMEWQGSCDECGYGRGRFKSKLIRIHRFVWELLNGTIPDELCVCHHCDNPKCINPNHLFLGTHQDNMKDMVDKGRGKFKLTDRDKERITQLAKIGIPQKDIAHEFGVHNVTISRISIQNGVRRLSR